MAWYHLLTTLVGLLVYPYGWLRAAFGSILWQGRLGLGRNLSPVDIWIHASSVGEVKVAETLIDRLRRSEAGEDLTRIHLTVMTPAGHAIASRALGPSVGLSFAPLDAGFLVRSVIKRLTPGVMIITETEIWPNMISETAKTGAKVILVNGRMSSRSVKQYGRVCGLIRSVMQAYTRCFFKSAEDLARYVALGLPEANGEIAGDMKFDTALLPAGDETIRRIRTRLGIGQDEFLIVAGSTRPDSNGSMSEEEILLKVYQQLKRKQPQLRLVLVPRHLERVDEVVRLVTKSGYKCDRLERPDSVIERSGESVIVVGYIGGLIELYQAADIAFVGGTLVPVGGHNLLEPVWSGTPVLFGPSLDNVTEASEYIMSNNYGVLVHDAESLAGIIEKMVLGEMSFERREPTDTAVSATGRVVTFLKEARLL